MKEIITFCMKGFIAMKCKKKRKLEILSIVLTVLFSLFTMSGCNHAPAANTQEPTELSAMSD